MFSQRLKTNKMNSVLRDDGNILWLRCTSSFVEDVSAYRMLQNENSEKKTAKAKETSRESENG